MLDPHVFRHTRRVMKFKPVVDLFASDFHHQLPRYYALKADTKAACQDAFAANWLLELRPYVNHPWYLIPKYLQKIRKDQADVMVVVPKWEASVWWPTFVGLCVRFIDLVDPVYLRPDKTLWKKPIWDTRIGILDGTRSVPTASRRK